MSFLADRKNSFSTVFKLCTVRDGAQVCRKRVPRRRAEVWCSGWSLQQSTDHNVFSCRVQSAAAGKYRESCNVAVWPVDAASSVRWMDRSVTPSDVPPVTADHKPPRSFLEIAWNSSLYSYRHSNRVIRIGLPTGRPRAIATQEVHWIMQYFWMPLPWVYHYGKVKFDISAKLCTGDDRWGEIVNCLGVKQ